MEIVPSHLSKLRECGYQAQAWVGQNLQAYAESVASDIADCDPSQLKPARCDRNYLIDLTQGSSVSTLTCCVAIFGWGGMRRDHAKNALQALQSWLPIVEDLRSKSLSRVKAYRGFADLRKAGSLSGMGPAFFTKLIYFFGKGSPSRGYIMDQWTARSANLLLEQDLVDLRKYKGRAWVTDKNSEETYDKFCCFLECLARELSVKTDVAEEMIFSVGNRGRKQTRGAWREYLLKYT